MHKGPKMTEKAFKEQVVDKLTSLARTIEFDNRYTVKHPYDPHDPYVDRPMEVYLGNKQIFDIEIVSLFATPYNEIDIHIIEDPKKSRTYIEIQEVKERHLFEKARTLYDLLANIYIKREKAATEKAKELQKEKERQQKQRLSEQQNAVLSYIDYLTHPSK